ncbi:hypothetical protein ACFPOD_07835 [Nitratireductor kimnyeongensis]|uniref:Tripartite tricarboxylate transporter TctB family protein n=1 Tax=Nitratireductor kimnyeongensis TaxID=430679 RepID=A0ABW0T6M3_9HYPH|nr:hypothetical protein [Nitratireductor kimnyeongensis]QZZ34045.1 hypothetical protein KW403_09370 [Nitratireductor kimnyeongensis]
MQDKTRLRQQDFWTALVLIAVSLFFLYKTSEIPFFRANAAGVESGQWYNSAALVPYGIFAAILVLGFFLLVTALRQGGAPGVDQLSVAVNWMRTPSAARMGAVALILLAYIFSLVPRVDFIICSALVLLALTYGFHVRRPRATLIALVAVLIPAAYALVMHFPQSAWNAPHDDDWLTLACFAALSVFMFVETRLAGEKPDGFLRSAPLVALIVPAFLIVSMAFGFRQNVPNRTGLFFKQIEYQYYVNVRPWLAGKKGS